MIDKALNLKISMGIGIISVRTCFKENTDVIHNLTYLFGYLFDIVPIKYVGAEPV